MRDSGPSSQGPSPLSVLTNADLATTMQMMDDGYSSIHVRTREEAAQAALDALSQAGFTLTHVLDDWREPISSREALRSELIRQHLNGECCGHPCDECEKGSEK